MNETLRNDPYDKSQDIYFEKIQKDEQKEKQEVLPLEIYIYAIEERNINKKHLTKNGFVYETLLDLPQKNIYYRWEGKLFSNNHQNNYMNCSNTRNNIEELAKNWALNYKDRQNINLKKQGKPSYQLIFIPPKTPEKGSYNSNYFPRALTNLEENLFIEAFKDENRNK